jgi:hypothetical protein
MTFPAEALVLKFFGAGNPLWWYFIYWPCSQDHSDGPKFHHLSLSALKIPHITLQYDPEVPLNLQLFLFSSHLPIFTLPTWHNLSGSQEDW